MLVLPADSIWQHPGRLTTIGNHKRSWNRLSSKYALHSLSNRAPYGRTDTITAPRLYLILAMFVDEEIVDLNTS